MYSNTYRFVHIITYNLSYCTSKSQKQNTPDAPRQYTISRQFKVFCYYYVPYKQKIRKGSSAQTSQPPTKNSTEHQRIILVLFLHPPRKRAGVPLPIVLHQTQKKFADSIFHQKKNVQALLRQLLRIHQRKESSLGP